MDAVSSSVSSATRTASPGWGERVRELYGDRSRWDLASWALMLLLVALACFTFRSYGVTADEYEGHLYGKNILRFYAYGYDGPLAEKKGNTYLYGGLVETIAALRPWITKDERNVYEVRHFVDMCFGLAGILGCWCLARRLGGPRVAFLAALFLAAIPSYYGMMFNNSKDVPFAAAYVWALYAIIRLGEPGRVGPGRALLAGLAIGAALAIRSGGLMLLGFLALALLLRVLTPERLRPWRWREMGREVWALAAPTLIVVGTAWLVMLAFWPWAWKHPFAAPFMSLARFSNYSEGGVDFTYLFMGKTVSAQHLPRTYIPVFLAVKLPELILLLLAVLPLLIRRQRTAGSSTVWQDVCRYVIFGAAFGIPFVSAIATRPVLYDEIRHFMFLYPLVAVLAALAAKQLWDLTRMRPLLAGALLSFALAWGVWHISVMIRLHPYQYVYYNIFAGGSKGAAKRFTAMDYWGSSHREAVMWLVQHLKKRDGESFAKRQYNVAVPELWWCAREYLPTNFVLVRRPTLPDVDYAIVLAIENRQQTCPGETVFAVTRMGTTLNVIKQLRPNLMIQSP